MLGFLTRAKQYLWLLVEVGFLAVLSILLIHIILGDQSGVFVTSVADNVLRFAGDLPPESLVGLAIVLALIVLIANRFKAPDGRS